MYCSLKPQPDSSLVADSKHTHRTQNGSVEVSKQVMCHRADLTSVPLVFVYKLHSMLISMMQLLALPALAAGRQEN